MSDENGSIPERCHTIRAPVASGDMASAMTMLPVERIYEK